MDTEDWREYHKMGQEKRAKNRESSATILTEHNVSFKSHNMGAHLIVTHEGLTADFWPGTGKYMVRGATQYRRGIYNLLHDLGVI